VKVLRVGLSGCTANALALVRAAHEHGHCRVVAAHDDDAARLARFCADAGIGFAAPDFAALLGSGVDFVVLTEGSEPRLARVRSAAEQVVPVLLEGPLAGDLETATAIVAATDAAEVQCGVLVPGQDDPLLEQLRRMIAADWLGGVVAVQALAGEPLALRAGPASLLPPFVQHTTHQLQLVSWLTGRAAVRVGAQLTRVIAPSEPDTGVATALLRGNVLATFTASHAFAGRGLAIHGTDGGVRIADDRIWLRGRREFRGQLFDYPAGLGELVLSRSELAPALQAQAAAHEPLGRFCRWLEDCDDFPCPAETALADLRAALAMQRAAQSRRLEDV
jgi:predicted dehydrogenase